MKTLLHGDHVRYIGGHSFANDDATPLNLHGKIGEVIAKVANDPGLVVDFGGTAFVIHPDHLEIQSWANTDEKQLRALERKWKTTEEKKPRGKGKGGDK